MPSLTDTRNKLVIVLFIVLDLHNLSNKSPQSIRTKAVKIMVYLQLKYILESYNNCVLSGQLGQWLQQSHLRNINWCIMQEQCVCHRWVLGTQQCWIHQEREAAVLLRWLLLCHNRVSENTPVWIDTHEA